MITYRDLNLAIFASGADFMKQDVDQNLFIELPVDADPLWNEICLNYFKLGHIGVLQKSVERTKQLMNEIRECVTL